MSVIKKAKDKAEKAWTTTKKLFVMSCLWGLIFSVVTIAHLGVAFDYDDTLVNSAAAYNKAMAAATQTSSPQFWSIVNQSYDLEQPKVIPFALAWAFRILGFRVSVLTGRPAVDAEPLKKEWRHLIGRGNFVFGADGAVKEQKLANGNYVLFFGDTDTDIEQARKAHVFALRVLRSAKSFYKEDYHPRTLGELVIPLSQY